MPEQVGEADAIGSRKSATAEVWRRDELASAERPDAEQPGESFNETHETMAAGSASSTTADTRRIDGMPPPQPQELDPSTHQHGEADVNGSTDSGDFSQKDEAPTQLHNGEPSIDRSGEADAKSSAMNTADIWTPLESAAPKAGTSLLFGTLLNHVKATISPVAKQVSSMFGDTLSKKNSKPDGNGPSFIDIQRAVHAEFEPAPPLVSPPVPESAPVPSQNVLPERETVPFLSPASRPIIPQRGVRYKEDEEDGDIVPVKRKRGKKPKIMQFEVTEGVVPAVQPANTTNLQPDTFERDDLGQPVLTHEESLRTTGQQVHPAGHRDGIEDARLSFDEDGNEEIGAPTSNSGPSPESSKQDDATSGAHPVEWPAFLRNSASEMLHPNDRIERKRDRKRKAVLSSGLATLTSGAGGPGSLPFEQINRLSLENASGPNGEDKLENLVSVTEKRSVLYTPRAKKRCERLDVRAKDIPLFDYSNEPNLLDNPTKGRHRREKKVKTAKPGELVIASLGFC